MQTTLKTNLLNKPKLQIAEDILRNCVHCGFCTAVCPTYRLLGNELDSPRGRIYLIKNVLEGKHITASTSLHLDRCLMCRSCESACPSGVAYYELLNAGKTAVSGISQDKTRIQKYLIRKFLTSGSIFNFSIKFASIFKFTLPKSIKHQLPGFTDKSITPVKLNTKEKVLLLEGCVQPALAPKINNATIKILEKLNIELKLDKKNTCCGAIDEHLGAKDEAHKKIRANVDRWYMALQGEVSAIISNISGCGATVKDYPNILADDLEYKEKSEFVAKHTMDIAEFLKDKDLSCFKTSNPRKIAFHPPCTLQHWQRINGVVEGILENTGFELASIENANICCGAAGTYSILQKEISTKLQQRKLNDLTIDNPNEIVTANIGCIKHLQSATDMKVRHWVELLE